MTKLYLNGEWINPTDAKVSVMDRGFLFGDGVYQVIPAAGQLPVGASDTPLRQSRWLMCTQMIAWYQTFKVEVMRHG